MMCFVSNPSFVNSSYGFFKSRSNYSSFCSIFLFSGEKKNHAVNPSTEFWRGNDLCKYRAPEILGRYDEKVNGPLCTNGRTDSWAQEGRMEVYPMSTFKELSPLYRKCGVLGEIRLSDVGLLSEH